MTTRASCGSHYSLFRSLLRCAERSCVAEGRSLHARLIKIGSWADVFLANSVVNMYAKCGHLSQATAAFDEMRARDVVSWNCLINSYSRQGPRAAAAASVAELFRRMRAEGGACLLPNAFTFAGVFTAAPHSPDAHADFGFQAHCVAVKTADCDDVFLGSSLLNMYCKLGLVSDARKVFDRMPHKNSVSWAAMISGYAVGKCPAEGFRLFRLIMRERPCSTNEFVVTSILSAVSLPGFLQMGRQIHALAVKNGEKGFDQLLEEDVVLWTTMIAGHVQNGEHEEALTLYGRMEKEGILPNNLTIVSVLRACSGLAALEQGKQMHARALKYGFGLGAPIGSALSSMYAKCGNLDDCALSSEECHRGMLSMLNDYDLAPRLEHYVCMVDILCRAGLLSEAKDFIESVPIDHGTCLWRIVLGACRSVRILV
uniref:Pentatricopeptide repeat-containing protein n=1 Tax=Ananas comosus var. bracteatus TaxID=296719 RepID=A0A6V7PET6_ANACO|nr:unnamed protein product [Ananas comosus var. bracteatus]